MTRRFTGRFELAGSYTMARAYTSDRYQDNPFESDYKDHSLGLQDHVVVTSYQVEIPNGSGFHNHDVSFFKDFVVRGNPTSGA